MPWCSCAEENLLNLRGDPYGGNGRQGSGENITIHEFSHTVASAIQRTQGRNGTFWTGLRKAYQDSLAAGGRLEAWNRQHNSKVYASVDVQEFWAEGAQAWFDNANPHNSGGLSIRADVKTKEPALAALLTDVYGDGSWRVYQDDGEEPRRSLFAADGGNGTFEGTGIGARRFSRVPLREFAADQGVRLAGKREYDATIKSPSSTRLFAPLEWRRRMRPLVGSGGQTAGDIRFGR